MVAGARVLRARCAAVGPETSRKARRGDAQQRPSCSEQSGGWETRWRENPSRGPIKTRHTRGSFRTNMTGNADLWTS